MSDLLRKAMSEFPALTISRQHRLAVTVLCYLQYFSPTVQCTYMLDNLHRDSNHAVILSNAFLIDTVNNRNKLHIDFTRFIC